MSAQAGVLLSKWPPPPGMTYQTQRADLGGQGRRGTDFPTGTPQEHDFDLAGVELRRHGGGGWCRMNPDSGRPKKVAPLPPPSRKPKAVLLLVLHPFIMINMLSAEGSLSRLMNPTAHLIPRPLLLVRQSGYVNWKTYLYTLKT